jgi:hypothetical protein
MSLSRRLHRAEAQLAARHPATADDDVWPAISAALDAGEAGAAGAVVLPSGPPPAPSW